MRGKIMNYTKFAVKGAVIVFVVSLLAAFLGYLVRLVLARNLTVEDFGLFYSVFAFLSLVTIFKTFGFDRALIKFIPEFIHNKRNDFIKSSMIYISMLLFITNVVIIIAIYLLSKYLSIHFFHNEKASVVLNVMAIAFFAETFVNVFKFSFQGFQKMYLYSSIDIVRMIIVLSVAVVGFKLNCGIMGPVAGYAAAPFILLILYGILFFKKVFPQFSSSSLIFNKILLRDISKYSFFIMATGAGVIILGYPDMMFLTYFSGVKEVALYSIALPTAKILIYFPSAISSILLPLTSELWTKKRYALLKDGMESLYKFSMIVAIPLVFVMMSFTNLLITVFFSANYVNAAGALKILSIGMLFLTIHMINVNFFLGIGKPQIQTKIVYLAGAFNVAADLVMIPILGVTGAAIAATASYFIMMAFGLIKVNKFIDIKLPIGIWIKTLLAGAAFILIISAMKSIINLNVWLETSIVVGAAGIFYAAMLFLFRILSIRELKEVYRRVTG